jgi:poly(beta-D-mannuronate) lyase
MRLLLALLATLLLAGPAAACPSDVPVVRDIRAERFYTDAASSIVDPDAVAANRAALRPLDAAVAAIETQSNRFLRSGDTDAAACALALLRQQAEGGAMLGTMASRQAGYERKWRTAGLAIVYLALKDQAGPPERAAIEPWLARLADAVEASDTRPDLWNNHHLWIGLVATAVGAATEDDARFSRGRRIFDDGLAAIQADGTLPREMERRGRALHYHNYALAPLVLSAEIAARRGENWYDRQDGALHRLAARVAAGLADPSWFTARTGVAAEVPTGGVLAWSEFYRRRFPDRPAPPPGRAVYSSFGGDMAALAARWLP